jgi:hypothetical protein
MAGLMKANGAVSPPRTSAHLAKPRPPVHCQSTQGHDSCARGRKATPARSRPAWECLKESATRIKATWVEAGKNPLSGRPIPQSLR